MRDAGFNGFQKQVDVFGYNYKPTEYGKVQAGESQRSRSSAAKPPPASVRAANISSPSATTRVRGKADFQMSSYDLYAPPWATPPDWEFHGQDEFPYVAGEFVWTGFDYLGEPTPYNARHQQPAELHRPRGKGAHGKSSWTNSEKSACRRAAPISASSIWPVSKKIASTFIRRAGVPSCRMAHILPHWNWPDRVGQVTPVHVYTSGDEAELFLNGKSLGRKKKGRYEYRLRWDDVVYQPGELKVVAYKKGKNWARDAVKTTGPATQLTLTADRPTLHADGT